MRAHFANLDAALRVRTRKGAMRRGWLLLGVAFVILTWLANVGHLTLVPHELCGDHGQLIHVDDTHGEAHAPIERGGVRHTGVDAGDGGDHSHDHCWAAAADVALSLSASSVVASVIVWSVTSRHPTPRVAADTRRFLLAPKTSPPSSS